MNYLMIVYLVVNFLFLACGGLLVAFSVLGKQQLQTALTPANVAFTLLLDECPLTGMTCPVQPRVLTMPQLVWSTRCSSSPPSSSLSPPSRSRRTESGSRCKDGWWLLAPSSPSSWASSSGSTRYRLARTSASSGASSRWRCKASSRQGSVVHPLESRV